MSAATAVEVAVRPFRFEAPQNDLVDLRLRLQATRWPDKETVKDESQGAQLARLQALVHYWGTDYDWEKSYPNVTYFHEVDKGGHFAAWEEPELFATEIRAAFRSLR